MSQNIDLSNLSLEEILALKNAVNQKINELADIDQKLDDAVEELKQELIPQPIPEEIPEPEVIIVEEDDDSWTFMTPGAYAEQLKFEQEQKEKAEIRKLSRKQKRQEEKQKIEQEIERQRLRDEAYAELIRLGFAEPEVIIEDVNEIKGYPELYEPQEVQLLFDRLIRFLMPIRNHITGKVISGLNGPFELDLESMNVDGLRRTFQFAHPRHLENFANYLSAGRLQQEQDSVGIYTIQQDGEEAWRIVQLHSIRIPEAGCNKHQTSEKNFKTTYYDLVAHNPQSMNNNCLFKCIDYLCDMKTDTKKIRRELHISGMISEANAQKIFKKLNINISIITLHSYLELKENTKYIIQNDRHYYALKSFKRTKEKKNTKRGDLFLDFETRPTEEFNTIKATGEKLYKVKDTLCCIYYRKYKDINYNQDFFLTDDICSSARKFINFLNNESKEGRSYNIIAHNGSRFDYFFILKDFNKLELERCELNFRGTSIIGINYNAHLFRDSCCFLTDTLKNLCSEKNFNTTYSKMTSIKLHGKILTNEELCFYKPELTFNQFINLNDPKFWMRYVKYCMYDCISLSEIWTKFKKQMNNVVIDISPKIARKCKIDSKLTIGSFAKGLINEMNRNKYKADMTMFTKSFLESKFRQDPLKHTYLRNFTQGGISHNEKGGRFGKDNTIVCYDIKSEYPASMKYAKVPSGKSRFVKNHIHVKGRHYGFYTITNIVFKEKCFLPVAINCKSSGETALNWNHQYINSDVLYVDSFMLEYLIKYCGLLDYTITEGLISDRYMKMNKLFARTIDKLYALKKEQDDLLEQKDKKYNGAIRAATKLVINSMSGKLIENPKNYFSIEFDSEGDEFNESKISKVYRDESYNEWLTCGIMVYSHSKRYLYDYLRCIPNKDFIHIETDSIYFEKKYEDEYLKNIENYNGEFKSFFMVGLELGNMEKECESAPDTYKYFLGKKMYAMSYLDDGKIKNKFRMKGCPMKSINKDGSEKKILSYESYETMWKGGVFRADFMGMKKILFGQTDIFTVDMSRNLRATNLNAVNKNYV